MNQSATMVQAPSQTTGSVSCLDSDVLLSELLTWNEEMVEQLRLESEERAGASKFLPGIIAQHEKAAAMLRAQLDPLDAA